MDRKPILKRKPDGSVETRLSIPREVALLAQGMATRMGADRSPEIGLRLLMIRIAALLKHGDATWLGPEWEDVLRTITDANFGDISTNEPIDLHLLARSNKTKSGFVGVYANGKGFRAHGKDPVTKHEMYICQAPTAEAAAWKRYLHYKRHGMPYGQYELDIEEHARQHNLDWDRARESLDDLNEHMGVTYRDGVSQIPEPKMLGFDEPPPELDERIRGPVPGTEVSGADARRVLGRIKNGEK